LVLLFPVGYKGFIHNQNIRNNCYCPNEKDIATEKIIKIHSEKYSDSQQADLEQGKIQSSVPFNCYHCAGDEFTHATTLPDFIYFNLANRSASPEQPALNQNF